MMDLEFMTLLFVRLWSLAPTALPFPHLAGHPQRVYPLQPAMTSGLCPTGARLVTSENRQVLHTDGIEILRPFSGWWICKRLVLLRV